MTVLPHPLARSAQTIRILHHTVIDVIDLLDADAFSLDGHQITIRRHARGTSPAVAWRAALGDWLVRDHDGWSISPDPCTSSPEIDLSTPAPTVNWSPLPF